MRVLYRRLGIAGSVDPKLGRAVDFGRRIQARAPLPDDAEVFGVFDHDLFGNGQLRHPPSPPRRWMNCAIPWVQKVLTTLPILTSSPELAVLLRWRNVRFRRLGIETANDAGVFFEAFRHVTTVRHA
jgi:hypothetical protein